MEPVENDALPHTAVKAEKEKKVSKAEKPLSPEQQARAETADKFLKAVLDVFPERVFFIEKNALKNFIETSGSGLLQVAIYFPEVTIRSSDRSVPAHTLRDFFAILGLDRDKAQLGRIKISMFAGMRSGLTQREHENGYLHSHLNHTGFFSSGGFCMGSSFLASLYSLPQLTEEDLYAFLFNIEPYLKHESIEGRPYKRLSQYIFQRNQANNGAYPSWLNPSPNSGITYPVEIRREIFSSLVQLFEARVIRELEKVSFGQLTNIKAVEHVLSNLSLDLLPTLEKKAKDIVTQVFQSLFNLKVSSSAGVLVEPYLTVNCRANPFNEGTEIPKNNRTYYQIQPDFNVKETVFSAKIYPDRQDNSVDVANKEDFLKSLSGLPLGWPNWVFYAERLPATINYRENLSTDSSLENSVYITAIRRVLEGFGPFSGLVQRYSSSLNELKKNRKHQFLSSNLELEQYRTSAILSRIV